MTAAIGATEAITAFLAGASAADFPAGAQDKAKRALADTFAVMLAGAGSDEAEPLLRYAGAHAESGAAPILGTGATAAPETAALVNGTLGHALDYDDVLSMMPAHPSAVILAAALASLDGRRASGRELIEAYVLGIEVGARIGLAITMGHYQRGFHATGTLALFSALAALAKLHRLDVAGTRQALGIAASMASGLRRNFGTMTKPLHSGLAARSALTALRLAQCGFTAAPDALEGPFGFFAAYGTADSDPGLAARDLGRPWVIVDPGLALKKFPCCYAAHRAMDGLLALRDRLGFDAAAVERVVCRMPPGVRRVLTYPRPATGLEGKFSLEYPLAAGALDGEYGLASFTDAAVRRPGIAALYDRIDAAEDDTCRGGDPRYDARSIGSRGHVEVEVRLRDGRAERIRVDKAPGAPGRELGWDDLRAKFADCARASRRVRAAAADEAFEAIRILEQAPDVGRIVELLR
jgi:2-methylcitrate dehydratase PrpD